MTKSKKLLLALSVIMLTMIFIPTFDYAEESLNFGTKFDYNWDGSVTNSTWNFLPEITSEGIVEHKESIAVFGFNGYKGEKIGFIITTIGVTALLILSFFKHKVSNVLSIAFSAFPIFGTLIQIYSFYTNPHIGTFTIHNPPFIALLLIPISIVAIIVCVKSLSKKEKEFKLDNNILAEQ